MRAACTLSKPCCSAHRCCLSPVLPRCGPGFSRGARKPVLTTAGSKSSNNGNEASSVESWLQQRTRLTVQYLKEQQAQWLYRYFRDWRKDAFRYVQMHSQITMLVKSVPTGDGSTCMCSTSQGAAAQWICAGICLSASTHPTPTATAWQYAAKPQPTQHVTCEFTQLVLPAADHACPVLLAKAR
jgi:hypothetical protein